MPKGQANINGQSYSFVDAKITIAGVELYSASQITAKVSQAKANNYGNQSQPQSRGRGRKEYEANFDFALKDILRLKKLAPGGDLTNLPPTTCVIFLDNDFDQLEVVLPYFEFTEDGIEFGDGDTEARKTFPGVMSNILFTDLTS